MVRHQGAESWGVSIADGIDASPAGRGQGRCWQRPQGLRWAMFRLVALWVPIAAGLALALWNVLFLSLASWGHHWSDDNPPALDALPSQVLFAVLLVLAGRVETARLSGSEASSASVRIFWGLSTLLIGLGAAAFGLMAMNLPELQ